MVILALIVILFVEKRTDLGYVQLIGGNTSNSLHCVPSAILYCYQSNNSVFI